MSNYGNDKYIDRLQKCEELKHHLRQYVEVMATEPEELIPLSKVYHDLRRILGDEE